MLDMVDKEVILQQKCHKTLLIVCLVYSPSHNAIQTDLNSFCDHIPLVEKPVTVSLVIYLIETTGCISSRNFKF